MQLCPSYSSKLKTFLKLWQVLLLERATKAGWEGKYLLSFIDNGNGMEPEDVVKMLKLGNPKERGVGEIGKWGVGFKHGVLRNAKEVAMGMQCTCVPDGMQASCDPEHSLGAYVLCAMVVYCNLHGAGGRGTGQ